MTRRRQIVAGNAIDRCDIMLAPQNVCDWCRLVGQI
jgi:hypothetical protein